MEYSIDKAARLAGVTARTLRHYDRIGLLIPKRVSNGYRIYGPDELDRLQQVLFYRELGLELGEIREILDDPEFDRRAALGRHLTELTARRVRLDGLIETVQNTILCLKGEKEMSDSEKFAAFKKGLIEENERKYGEEIRAKYGEEQVEASNRKLAGMSEAEYAEQERVSGEILERLRKAVTDGLAPGGEEGQAIAALHRRWLEFHWTEYNPQAHCGLAEMYVADERFTAFYDSEVPGCAAFLRDAIVEMVG